VSLHGACMIPFLALFASFAFLNISAPSYAWAMEQQPSSAGNTQVAKAVGTIKSVQADSVTVSAESGGEITAKLQASTKILRVPPGEKDLKNATALRLSDLQPGDRVLVRGQASADGPMTIVAGAVIVMKQADVTAKQLHDRDDWQKRGAGGLVTKVDAAAGTVTISSGGMGATHNIAIHVTKDTILRRYAHNSVKFDEAKPAPIDQIKVGDQLRARGTRTADGNELAAEEVVSGSFRNIAGTVTAVDLAANTMTVQDAIRKSAVVVKVSSDSQMKKLPAEMAQRIAMRLKASSGGGGADDGQVGTPTTGQNVSRGAGSVAGGGVARPGADSSATRWTGAGAGGNGTPDFQRMLSRLPASTLSDWQKGDAVMIVSTESSDSTPVTAITMLAGVDAILRAAPDRSASSLLSPWSLGGSPGEGEGSPQ
jgi:Domain of unknown function (DUF5666)